VNSSSNGKVVIIPKGDRVLVRLNENTTTGYEWGTTVTKGLSIVFDNYFPLGTSLTGAGGYHEWILRPQMVDTYTFRAVSLRSGYTAEPPAETFTLVIQATRD
jgi:predicted secreted protein